MSEQRSVLDGGFLLASLSELRDVELRHSPVGVETVYLLLDIIELGVAETHDQRVVKKDMGQACKAGDEFLLAFGVLSVSPSVGSIGLPADSAIFADKYRLALPLLGLVRNSRRDPVEDFAVGELLVVLSEAVRVLIVVMNVVDIGHEVVSAARVDDRAGRVVHFRHVVDRREERVRPILLHISPSLVERAPTDDRWVIEVAHDDLHPLVEVYLGSLSRSAVEAPVAHLDPCLSA